MRISCAPFACDVVENDVFMFAQAKLNIFFSFFALVFEAP